LLKLNYYPPGGLPLGRPLKAIV